MRAASLFSVLSTLEDTEDVGSVYARLVLHHPEYEELFVLDQSFTVRGSMLQAAYECITDYAEGGEQFRLTLEATRLNHEAYNLSSVEFLSFFDVIETGLRGAVGARWTDDVTEEWAAMINMFESIFAETETG